MSLVDRTLTVLDASLRTVFAPARAQRPCPSAPTNGATDGAELSSSERQLAGALMRVNHVGEVCAQALYTAQAAATRNPALKRHFEAAAREEMDHLAWTESRLRELGARPSLLNPLWYAGAFGLGLLAGRFGDRVSLGFVLETERQVEAHLQNHLDTLPTADLASRAIVRQMQQDEAAHASEAVRAGAMELPTPVLGLMRAAAKVMTTTAHHL